VNGQEAILAGHCPLTGRYIEPCFKAQFNPSVRTNWRLTVLKKDCSNLVPRAFLVVARELRKTLVKYDEISKILGDLSHAQ
jgi:hypothetical protein